MPRRETYCCVVLDIMDAFSAADISTISMCVTPEAMTVQAPFSPSG